MRWLITARTGQVGSRLASALADEDAICVTRRELDITSRAAVNEAIAEHRPDVVINAAAYTAVDDAESDEAAAMMVNRDGPANLAAAIDRCGGRLIHISTDYVFAGDASRPYEVGDPTGPRTVYGRTKLAGEIAVRQTLPERSSIVRTAWLYGGPGANFVDTMIRLERERDSLEVVKDQTGSPTYVGDLAYALIELGRRQSFGLLHYVNHGRATWFTLARATFRLIGADPERIRPAKSSQLRRPAPRPAWSVLGTNAWAATGLPAPRHWHAALSAHVETVLGNKDKGT